jgi:hypothetical protein
MHVDVGPARRPGNRTAIYDEPLKSTDFQVDDDGVLTLTIDAKGMNGAKSMYRYRIRLTYEEAISLVGSR